VVQVLGGLPESEIRAPVAPGYLRNPAQPRQEPVSTRLREQAWNLVAKGGIEPPTQGFSVLEGG